MIKRIKDEDILEIQEWYKKRGLKDESSMFSTIGFISDNIAAGFLYVTNSNAAFIENLITNPSFDKISCDKALDEVVLHIIEEARSLHFTNLIGLTKLDAITKRAKKLGFALDSNTFKVVNYKIGK